MSLIKAFNHLLSVGQFLKGQGRITKHSPRRRLSLPIGIGLKTKRQGQLGLKSDAKTLKKPLKAPKIAQKWP